MINPSKSYIVAYKAGFFAMALLLIHAALFYKARTALADDAFYLYEMARTGRPTIQHFRFVSLLTECLPLLAIRTHASLRVVAVLWSAAFPLFYLCCYYICGSLLRAPQAALCLLIYLILFGTHTHYWYISELSLGAALVFVLLAYALSNRSLRMPPVLDPVSFLLLAIIGFAHPLLLFAVAFMLAYAWLRFAQLRSRWIAYAIQYAAVLLVKFTCFKEPYESSAMEHIDNFKLFFPDYLHHYSNARFLREILGIWCAIPLAGIAIVSVYVARRSWPKLVLFIIAMCGFLLLVNISHPDRLVETAYIENLYLPMGLFLALPLLFDVWPQAAVRRGMMPAFAIIAAICLLRIWNAHSFYNARLAWVRGLIYKYEGRKVILEATQQPRATMMWNWGLPYEVWLLSAIESGHVASVVVHDGEEVLQHYGGANPKVFLQTYGEVPYAELPGRYFPFRDTISVYRHIRN